MAKKQSIKWKPYLFEKRIEGYINSKLGFVIKTEALVLEDSRECYKGPYTPPVEYSIESVEQGKEKALEILNS